MNITTHNLHEHTAQEVFDFVVGKVLEQGCKSVQCETNFAAVSCMYRSNNGNKCAFGHVIADEDYRSVMENKIAQTVFRDHGDMLGWKLIGENPAHLGLIMGLQQAHDDSSSDNFRFEFANKAFLLASNRGLDTSALGKLLEGLKV